MSYAFCLSNAVVERLHTILNDMSPIEFECVKEMCAA